MVFPQGNHHVGIKNEKNIVSFQNENPENSLNRFFNSNNNKELKWVHRGGTKEKADCLVEIQENKTINISIKNHKSGTFDWENTTKSVPENIKKIVLEFKKNNLGKEVTKELRKELESIFSHLLENIDSSILGKLLSELYEKYPEYIIINKEKEKKLVMFHKTNLKKYFRNDVNFILKCTKRAKTSRQIWIRENDGTEVNTKLRLRLHLNNGITALLGKSKCNKSSVPTIKIQQDSVDNFINNCDNKTICSY